MKEGKKVVDFMRSQREAAKARIIARRGRLNVTVDPLNVAGLVDEAIIGASYVTEGITKLSEWSAKMLADFGERIRPYLSDLFERSKQFHEDNAKLFEKTPAGKEKQKVPVIEKAKANAAAGKGLDPQIVFDLAREKVRAGMEGLDNVMMAVHSDLKALHPEATVRDVRDAFSGYGKTTTPSKEADLVALRELRRQGQLVSAIEDAQRKVAPMKSGPQRDAASQKVRELQKQLKESMRASGIETRSPETQLKSANAARATALRNQIADIDKQLRTGEKPPGKTPVAASPEVERLRAERDAMKEKLAEIEAEQNPKPSPEERQLASDKKAIQTRIKQIEERIKAGDYGPKPKKTPLMDKEKADLQFQYQKAKEAYLRGLFEARLKQRTTTEKAIDGALNALGFARALKLGIDLGVVMRQGRMFFASHPIKTIKGGIPDMFRGIASEKGQFRVMEEIKKRKNYPIYKQAGLFLQDEGELTLSRMEEEFQSRWIQSMPTGTVIGPILRASNRATVTFLNRIRADYFDALVDSHSETGTPTPGEAKIYAQMVNAATGRGNVGRASTAIPALNAFLLAPRFYASRLQLLTGQSFLWKTGKGTSTAQTRKVIAKEYARALAGQMVYYGLIAAALSLSGKDDDNDEGIIWDPRSSDFGKIKVGNTKIDPWAGLAQFAVVLTRLATGETMNAKGKVVPLRGEKAKRGKEDIDSMMKRFLESKRSPNFALMHDILRQKHYGEVPLTKATLTEQALSPISARDTFEILTQQGIPAGPALTFLMFFGEGISNFDKQQKR